MFQGTAAALLVGLMMSGCALSKPTLDAAPNEVVVVGKFQVRYNGEDVTDGAAVLFDEHIWGTSAAAIGRDGWLMRKLPLGQHHIDRLGFAKFPAGQFHYDFTPEQTAFTPTKGGGVYYIGHVVIDWHGQSFKVSQFLGLVGAIADQMANDGVATVTVTDDANDAHQMLAQKFSRDVALEKALVPAVTGEAAAMAQRDAVPVWTGASGVSSNDPTPDAKSFRAKLAAQPK
jgi:hypothetical protein